MSSDTANRDYELLMIIEVISRVIKVIFSTLMDYNTAFYSLMILIKSVISCSVGMLIFWCPSLIDIASILILNARYEIYFGM